MNKEDIFFAHDKIRDVQSELVSDVIKALKTETNLIAHAPTGLGKTAATLGPALKYAIDEKKTIFFLTGRHTQHHIVIDTLKKIKKKHNIRVNCCDIIGKQAMCPVPAIQNLYSNEFIEYCKSQRENDKCKFYLNTKKKSNRYTVKAQKIIDDIMTLSPVAVDETIELCKKEELCPYEINTALASKSQVIIADYFLMFHPEIRKNFMSRCNKTLQDSIIIVDEAHNLPKRARDLLTDKLSNFILDRAKKEAKKYAYHELKDNIEIIEKIIKDMGSFENKGNERLVKMEEFVEHLKANFDIEQFIADCDFAADNVREQQKQSFIGAVGEFIEGWHGPDTGFARILERIEGRKEELLTLSYRCLDPSIITKEVFKECSSAILMSGTLTPTYMYKDILGLDKAIEKEYRNPFSQKNRLNIIIPKTTTKFTRRNEEEYKKIATVLSAVTNVVPGNCAVFFPSYYLRDNVNRYYSVMSEKTIFLEDSRLTKQEKKDMLERFKEYSKTGAVLLGAATGSFGEGIDLPGEFLKCVVVIGLPLEKPSLETKELIDYYDKLFSKGWEYGYIFPAITKIMQNAGRCIRTEKDRGVIAFIDERYAWPSYRKCFPAEWDMKISNRFVEMIEGFFLGVRKS